MDLWCLLFAILFTKNYFGQRLLRNVRCICTYTLNVTVFVFDVVLLFGSCWVCMENCSRECILFWFFMHTSGLQIIFLQKYNNVLREIFVVICFGKYFYWTSQEQTQKKTLSRKSKVSVKNVKCWHEGSKTTTSFKTKGMLLCVR